MAGLRLEVREFRDLTRWRWVLTDASGAFVADHEVRLDPRHWQYEAFADLTGYLRWHAAPDQRAADEARIVAEVGSWIGAQVLGPVAAALLREARRRPVALRVVVPAEATELLYRPLELAYADGKPLAVQDVTLVMAAWTGARIAPVGERLRVLGLFSLPEGGKSLNLRHERRALVQLIHGIAAVGKAADVRVLQYGVTRERLTDVLAEGEGWDVIHISGHGRPGELLLETAAGQQDRITAAELADLLDLARERVKLVTVAACWSAAVAVADQRRLLELPVSGDDESAEPTRTDQGTGSSSGALATELASRLSCAVLAMRYPVGDEFAQALTGKLYDLLARQGQPLPRAVGMTLRQLREAAFPALSLATPALFGDLAADLRVAAPDRSGPADYDTAALKLAGFPPRPERFVGRTGVMARASAALAAASGLPGVLLHGMPGGGKTACALELADGHAHAFDRLIWYKAPDEEMAIDGALTDFALTLERYLDGFQLAQYVADTAALAGFLPRLAELMERARLLIVIDNAESLLTGDGTWRDDRWAQVIAALTGHAGRGRLVLTTRRVPAGLSRLRAEAIDALSADEALLLTRELPHLQALIRGEVPGLDRPVAKRLARRALETARGHPKLLELADGQAAHPERLAALVAAGGEAWRKLGAVPEGFFTGTGTAASGPDYLRVLQAWTGEVAESLTSVERDVFRFLCCLEEGDRERAVVNGQWTIMLRRPPDELAQALTRIAARGLVALRGDGQAQAVVIHPGVAAAGRAQAGQPFRDALDEQAAALWIMVYEQNSGAPADRAVNTELAVRAALAAVPYLIRQQQWETATSLLEGAFLRAPTRPNAAVVIPYLTRAVRHTPPAAGVLALVLRVADPATAESRLRGFLTAVAAAGDYRAATVTAGHLADLLRDTGQAPAALALAEQMADYARRAGLGPWSRLACRVRRLQALNAMGRFAEVAAEVSELRDRVAALPEAPPQASPGTAAPPEVIPPYSVREGLLDTGCYAADQLGRHQEALDLNAAHVASLRVRSAPAAEIAQARFNDYAPLMRLDRIDEALRLLLECRAAFEEARDIQSLGRVISALASVEDKRGHGQAAIRLQRDALRYCYLAQDATAIAITYNNLGNFLRRHARQGGPAIASHLAAALIHALTESALAADSVRATAVDLGEFGPAGTTPADVADLDRRIGEVPGTGLPRLIDRLCPDPAIATQVLGDLIATARELATRRPL